MDLDELYNLINNAYIFKFNALARKSKLNKKELSAMLESLVNDNKIIHVEYFDEYYPLKKAKLIVKESGYAFGVVEGEDNDYYIPEDYLPTLAFTGDIATIYPYEKGSKLYNAKVLKIDTHQHEYVIGILKCKKTKKGEKYYISSTMKSFDVKVNVRKENLNNAGIGSVVKADIVYEGTAINGKITDVVGYPDDPGIDISQIALAYGFKTPFPDDVNEEIKGISDHVLEEEKKDRRDFTSYSVITIDGDDSKDFDDAVYAEKLANGNFMLQVHIADVSNYVKEQSPLDKEALTRGTSVYLADRVIPMLPRYLSNGICSLNEGVERLTLSCIMEIDLKGNLVNYEICEGVIKSRHRMTYNKVNAILNGDEALCKEYSDIVDMLNVMIKLSKIIRERRYKKGGLEFEVDEYKITLYEDGSPKDIVLRSRGESEKMIEDFMLQANETVAYNMSIMNLPCSYRVHEKPDQEKLHSVFQMISNMGVELKANKNDIKPHEIQNALEKISDSPYSPVINSMLLRSMMKAKYSEKCLGHYGLAMNYYCHFTSPIRRYPDLITHRMIKNLYLHPSNLDYDINHFEAILPEICVSNSLSERKSIECEREVDDMLYAWYMSRYINSKFTGRITSMTQFGMFITLNNGIEGMVSYKNMDGYFVYDEEKMAVESINREYKIGQEVTIVVIRASKEERKIDFMLEEDYNTYYGEENENNMYK